MKIILHMIDERRKGLPDRQEDRIIEIDPDNTPEYPKYTLRDISKHWDVIEISVKK